MQAWRTGRPQPRRRSVAAEAQAAAIQHLLPVLADVAANVATAAADAITLTTAEGSAVISITPPVGVDQLRNSVALRAHQAHGT